jgi:uncharacterized protein (DUF58 family)
MELHSGPYRPGPEVARASARLALVWRPRTGGGAPGERLGRASGASLEFADRRAYTPGDDVRHIDWRAFARSDQLLVRTFREEIAPRLDVVLDTSRSLAVEADKARGALDVAALWCNLGRGAGFATRLVLAGDSWRAIEAAELASVGVRFDGRATLDQAFDRAASLPTEGVRVVVSDWFQAASLRTTMRRAFHGAAAGIAVAVRLASEERPTLKGALRLVDAESGEARDVVVDEGRLARYRERFERWSDELASEARRLGVLLVPWTLPEDLTEAARRHLGPLGLVAAPDA